MAKLTSGLNGLLGQMTALTARQMEGGGAAYGELGGLLSPRGISTEISVTEYVPELGGWVNIPTLVEGQPELRGLLSENMSREQWDSASRYAIQRAIERVKNGEKLNVYPSRFSAESAAERRSAGKGGFLQGVK